MPDTKRRAVVLVADEGFLVPSLVAADQAARSPGVADIADILVFTTDLKQADLAAIEAEFARSPIRIRQLDPDLFLPPADTFFNQTHISRTALGRLALHKVLPPHYEHIVYLDGDVQIVGEILPLVAHDVAPGRIAAANEFLWLCDGDWGSYWREHRAYLSAIGVDNPADYFNSGILAFRADTWQEMAPNALDYFNRFPKRCIYHDQSALNAVFVGRREILSPVFNYNSEFVKLGSPEEALVAASILHFTGAEKPWFYPGPPWNGRFIPAYDAFVRRHPALKSLRPQTNPADLAQFVTQRHLSARRVRLSKPWRPIRRRRMFGRYMQQGDFDVG